MSPRTLPGIALLVAASLLASVPGATAADIAVTSAADVVMDDGTCTLREAITAANANVPSGAASGECAAGTAGSDAIVFALGAGTPRIDLLSQLPFATEPLVIDGGTGGATRVELNGSAAGTDAAGLTLMGGSSTVRALVIDQFDGNGIALLSDGNHVEDCRIGVDATGGLDRGNGADGVLIYGSANVVGGTAAGTGNLLSGNASRGVEIAAGGSGNLIQGNLVGTDATGTTAIGNGDVGILIFGATTTLGGTTAGARNVVSGNGAAGVRIDGAGATGNVVAGNYLGTNATGTLALGNGTDGVLVAYAATGNTVGGTAAGAGNVISGNGAHGVAVSATATANTIQGNYIGTTVTGGAALGNVLDGIALAAPGNAVGGTSPGAGNVISGNGLPSGSGVYVDPLASGSTIQGNRIGTNAAGTAAIPNAFNGVQLRSANNVVGGTAAGAGNVVSGNTTTGILITASATGNVVEANVIGTAADGTSSLGNGRDGITLGSTTTGPASNNTIGGSTPAARNVIAFNARDGVRVTSGTGNAILSNAIVANTGLGIDLGGNGVTPNDGGIPPDADTGPNTLQNFPVLGAATNDGTSITIEGTLDSTPGVTFTIQVFANPTCDGTHGEGRDFIGSLDVASDATGHAAIAALFAAAVPAGHVLTATATDPGDNTSEFSACITPSVVTTTTTSTSTSTTSTTSTSTTTTSTSSSTSSSTSTSTSTTVTPSTTPFPTTSTSMPPGLVPGGGAATSDCYVELAVAGVQSPGPQVERSKIVRVVEGDAGDVGPCGDFACTVRAGLRLNEPDPNLAGCVPPAALAQVRVRGKAHLEVPPSLTGPQRGEVTDLAIPLKVTRGRDGAVRKTRPGTLRAVVKGKAPQGTTPRTDGDRFTIVCVPRTRPCPAAASRTQ